MHVSSLWLFFLVLIWQANAYTIGIVGDNPSSQTLDARENFKKGLQMEHKRSTSHTDNDPSPEDWCRTLGDRCKMIGGLPKYQPPQSATPPILAKIGKTPDSLNPLHGKEIEGHPDGNSSHNYEMHYSAALTPIGVCNPVKFLQLIIDRSCPKGDTSSTCRAKAVWPCEYQDDKYTHWSPSLTNQSDIRTCTMGVDAFFSTNKEINAGGTKYADFMKDWIVKAMQATTQIPGGNSSTHPINGGPNNPGIKPPNVTVWSVPAQMKAVMYELRPNQPADVQGNNAISVSISCPKPKETANLCAVAGSLIALAAAVLGVFTEGITASLLGAVGATAGAGGAGCGAATS